MSTLQDYISALGNLVAGDLPLGETEKIQAVNTAVMEHSKHRPREIIEDFSGDGGFDYPISGFSGWSEGSSWIKQVEYPVDDTDQIPDILQADTWVIYEKPAGKCLRFLDNKPAADETFRVTYTTPHTCTDLSCSITPFDEKAVQMLAAAHLCMMLSTYYAQNQDSTINADSVDHTSKSRDYAAKAKTYRKMYFDHLGIKEGEAKAASITSDWDKEGSWGSEKLTHKKRYR